MMRRVIVTALGFILMIFWFKSPLPVMADMDWNVLDLSASRKERVGRPPKCKECHQEIYDTVLKFPGKHSIVVLRECEKCHLADRTTRSGFAVLGSNEWRQMEVKEYSNEHLISLTNVADENKYFIQVDVRGRSGAIRRSKKILFTPGDISEYWVDDNSAPALKGIGVKNINISVLPSADINVQSDKMVRLKVNYGPSVKYGKVAFSPKYKKKHTVRLQGLHSKKRYHYRVAASDPFDNTTVSDDFTFTTDSPLKEKVDAALESESNALILYPPKIVRFLGKKSPGQSSGSSAEKGRGVAVFITANSEVTVSVRLKEAEADDLKDPKSQFHGKWGLRGQLKSGVDACVNCHFDGASHPVGMVSKGKTVIPKGLPTARGGVMTCATCHNPHGSKYSYLARVDFSEKLCTMCHQGNFL